MACCRNVHAANNFSKYLYVAQVAVSRHCWQCPTHADDAAYEINLKQVVLQCSFIRSKPQILRMVNDILSKEPALCNAPRSEIATYTVPTGVTSFHIPNMYIECHPKCVVFALQHRACFKDDPHRNPYSFIPVQRY